MPPIRLQHHARHKYPTLIFRVHDKLQASDNNHGISEAKDYFFKTVQNIHIRLPLKFWFYSGFEQFGVLVDVADNLTF